ncbi:MAG: flagellar biosynthesis protein FlgH, partial [Gammaproteobacteria bacterium]|nr:flagellar biosynthesis protein FlgH [Gammaproteobacteria bacterium]
RDIRAHRVGDILTIKLVESTTATKTAETTVEQETDFSVTNPTLFGATPSMLAPKLLTDGPLPLGNYLPSPTSDNRYTMGTSLASGKDFDGSGDSNQSNSLTGEITVSVAQVLPNGNLVVQGEKIFTLNRGHEHIRISGIVRPTDIDSDNTVVSTRVANATIVYSGEGEVADASKLGWLARFFVSAFWPF